MTTEDWDRFVSVTGDLRDAVLEALSYISAGHPVGASIDAAVDAFDADDGEVAAHVGDALLRRKEER